MLHVSVFSVALHVTSLCFLSVSAECGEAMEREPTARRALLDVRLCHEWVKQLVHMCPQDYRTPDHVRTLMHWAVRGHALEHPLRDPVYSTRHVNRKASPTVFVSAV